MAMVTTEIGERIQPRTIFENLEPERLALPRWVMFVLIFGLYLTFRGYHSFDVDQAYRLPILLHRQDPNLYETDPFVRAFDTFNPHQGYLTLLDWTSRPFGLATALAGLFTLTLLATTSGIDRLTRSVWPESGRLVGILAVVLILAAKAGNLGTNQLFEATLLDRLVGFALGWLALASTIGDPRRGIWVGASCLGLAMLIHPSVGLKLAMTLGVAWSLWGLMPGLSGVSRKSSALAVGILGLALTPGVALMAGQSGKLFSGLPAEEFRLLSVMIQSPQHMLPSSWRMSQWLAWSCYPVLAALALVSSDSKAPWPLARTRLVVLMAVNLTSLGLAYLAVEVVRDLRITVFQPFRMASLARGLALVVIAGRVLNLWNRADLASRGRAVLIGIGLAGDWMMVVATSVDLGMALAKWASIRGVIPASKRATNLVGAAILTAGLVFMARHDTESGHLALLGGLAALRLGSWISSRFRPSWTPRRLAFALIGSWVVPASALLLPLVVADPLAHFWSASLVGRCRFAELPTNDLERLAVWVREHTPKSSRFIGPPGPKTFRLWSRRSLAFNRAGSPYHAEGLAEWADRFRDHVGFEGSTLEFARAYLKDRHALEAQFDRLSPSELQALARRQGASYVLASSRLSTGSASALKLLRAEGCYAIYQVKEPR